MNTFALRVPGELWRDVLGGRVTEFRSNQWAAALPNVPTPCVCIGFRKSRATGWDLAPIYLESMRRETLGDIDAEGLRHAGYDTADESRAYREYVRDYKIREKKRFEPRRMIGVFRVRPVSPDDVLDSAKNVWNYLYRDFPEVHL